MKKKGRAAAIETASAETAWAALQQYKLGPFSPAIRREARVDIPKTANGRALAHGLSVIARRFREPYAIAGLPTEEELPGRLFELAIDPNQKDQIKQAQFDLTIIISRNISQNSSQNSPAGCDPLDTDNGPQDTPTSPEPVAQRTDAREPEDRQTDNRQSIFAFDFAFD